MRFFSLLATICAAVMLQGCIGAVVVSSAAVATKTATDPRTIGQQVDDSTLEARVSNALNKDKQLKEQTRIITTAYQGKVLLTGQTPDSSLSDRAKQIASRVDGAHTVYNEIRQGKPVELGTASKDTWVTTKVRSKILASDSVKSSNIKVVTENGEVFLLGILTKQEGNAAAKIASETNGVKRVTTAFTYLN
ncbi:MULTISPECIES: division/outer membrane stress-associated lipid-binding lipoprotein [Photorhabdus]|uniref:Divisome-associated lipoprotein YraP n=2 Tax=Photorhabdus TaxID=29487 RepID=A0ABX0B2U1_9GAMM|nr:MULTISPECIES: division/outer membrane stress-associated lipid-binding lipoprotein [Photorhabdus]MCC8374223.1 divisome-associated lipoprotein YraP [Photorhabdus bodei]MCC8464529.1 divisome-associated lipoprotein YraP [Photorhabdus bodei]MCT8353309.1 divisome-associated lipoprotein YraP [Photorhabdus kayaii]MDB6368258.1 division/outer membrane stress-associated lipid-binding lipoprotein [Photorhabdus bodei]MDB6372979.1 division/outer membrane stress-associated lipid-binding lipoprotein [Photo